MSTTAAASLQAAFEEVLDLQGHYTRDNTPEMKRRGVLVRKEIPDLLRPMLDRFADVVPTDARPLDVEGRDGTGGKTECPWTRVHSVPLSPEATTGWYVVFLFARDGSSAALCLRPTTSTFENGQNVSLHEAELQARVDWAREVIGGVPAWASSSIDLRGRRPLSRSYERGVAAAIVYQRGSVPADEDLLRDLERMLGLLGDIHEAELRGETPPGHAAQDSSVSNVVTVYVGQASQANLRVGLDAGVWGFKRDFDELAKVQPGDVFLLASGYSGGSPRVKPAEWQQHELASIEIGEVTSTPFHDDEPVWPDEHDPDVSYPHRFRFERRGRAEGVDLAEHGPLGETVAEGLRRSAVNSGRPYVHESPTGFRLVGAEAPAEPAPPPVEETVQPANASAVVASFNSSLTTAGLQLDDDLALRFVCALMAKPFVICAGLSGSGKTQLAVALGRWLGDDSRVLLSPVRPDWTGAEALFGFENMLLPPSKDGRPGWTVPPQLRFMLSAADNPEEPYLLVLDEMNLAHVERYFADVLSGMESGEPVLPNLVEEDDGIWRLAPGAEPRLPFPPNLLVVGTVNMDETTYQFSPKVLDRSTTLEFRVTTASLTGSAPQLNRIEPATRDLRLGLLAARATDDDWPSEGLRKRVEELHRLLATHGREFGHRTFQEMRRYAVLVTTVRPDLAETAVLDHLVVQKVLPRLSGSARELRGVIGDLAKFCAPDDGDGLPLSADKLVRMTVQMESTHFTAF